MENLEYRLAEVKKAKRNERLAALFTVADGSSIGIFAGGIAGAATKFNNDLFCIVAGLGMIVAYTSMMFPYKYIFEPASEKRQDSESKLSAYSA